MADLEEVAGLLHTHKALHEHGDTFKNLKAHVWDRLKQIEEEHGPKADAPETEPPAETPTQPDDPPTSTDPSILRRV